MPGRDEIVRSLTGAWRLFLDRPDALRYFDLSVDGFWRSFGAIVLILPTFALIAAGEHARILAEPVTSAAFSESAFFLNKVVGLALDWVAFPVLLALVAGPLGLGRGYTAFIVARNWGAVLAVLPFAAIALLFLGGIFSDEAANVVSLLVLIVVIRFSYLIARRALGADIPMAVGLVVADFAVSVLLVGFVDAIFPYGALTP